MTILISHVYGIFDTGYSILVLVNRIYQGTKCHEDHDGVKVIKNQRDKVT